MPYKPKYCCQCGEKIDGVDRKTWKSGRFCDFCATEFGIYDKAKWVMLGIVAVFGLYGINSFFQQPDKQLNIASHQIAALNVKSNTNQQKNIAQVSSDNGVQMLSKTVNSTEQTKPQTIPATTDLKVKSAELSEKVYFCGAPTKKGTMCSRRVKNGGRCWQHEGQTAMLPQEKLLAAQ